MNSPARRQQEVGREADHRRAKRVHETRRPQTRQQVLPPDRPQRVGHQRGADRERQQPETPAPQLGPNAGEIDAAHEPGEQDQGECDDEDGSQVCAHLGNALYYKIRSKSMPQRHLLTAVRAAPPASGLLALAGRPAGPLDGSPHPRRRPFDPYQAPAEDPPMTLPAPLLATSFPGLAPLRSGKVRDLYEAGRGPPHRRDRPHLGVRLRARDPAFPTRGRC